MSFEKLVEEIGIMTKAIPSDTGKDDKKIQAAAADGDGNIDDDDKENGVDLDEELDDEDELDDEMNDVDEDDEGKDKDKGMAKSFQLRLEDGSIVEAEDGTELVKALMNRVEKNESLLAKALEGTVNLIKSQGEMIKSLEDKVVKLSGQGKGRKAMLSIVEKQSVTMTKSEPEGISTHDFMAKALVAQAEGRITGMEVARAESYINSGIQIPQDIVARVFK